MTPIRPMIIRERSRWRYVPHALAIVCLWLTAMTMDYHDQTQAAEERAARMNAEHTACLRGEWRAVTAEGIEIGCLPVETFDPKKGS